MSYRFRGSRGSDLRRRRGIRNGMDAARREARQLAELPIPRRARPALIRQAIERTRFEIECPRSVWPRHIREGFGAPISYRELVGQARRRLAHLEGMLDG